MYKKLLNPLLLAFIVTLLWSQDSIPTYNRRDYRHWIDEDKDGINTRHEVLIEESLIPVTMSANGKSVVAGLWVDPYTGDTNTDPSALDVDHMVPLKNAHNSGAWQWDKDKKELYANYLEDKNHLIAVAKGDKSPHQWLPPNEAYRCEYVSNFVAIKEFWGLEIHPDTMALYGGCVAGE